MTSLQEMRVCSRCNSNLPLNAEFFGHTPSGGFRSYCRKCKNEQTSEWQKANKWSDKNKWEKQNAARANTGSFYTCADINNIRKKLGDKCAYCGAALDGRGEIDHMIALDNGGTNSSNNLTLACMPCNRAKGNRSPVDFLRYREERSLLIRPWAPGCAPWSKLK